MPSGITCEFPEKSVTFAVNPITPAGMMLRSTTIIFLLMICQIGGSQTVNLNVTVSNLKEVSGVMFISLYNTESSFPIDGKEFRKLSVKVTGLSVSCSFNELARGEYAVALFHDQNNDGICNLGVFGVPKEGFGFSKNFRPRLRAPDFDDCKITILENMAITIDLIFK